jgi:undecaprenyl pyrophosphate synthase
MRQGRLLGGFFLTCSESSGRIEIVILYKRIEIDLEKERARIAKCKFSKRQRKALTTLVDLFEQGKFQDCLNHINDDKNFPEHPTKEYSEREHISIEIGDALHNMVHSNYYTRDEILRQAKEILTQTGQPAIV